MLAVHQAVGGAEPSQDMGGDLEQLRLIRGQAAADEHAELERHQRNRKAETDAFQGGGGRAVARRAEPPRGDVEQDGGHAIAVNRPVLAERQVTVILPKFARNKQADGGKRGEGRGDRSEQFHREDLVENA